MFRLTYATCAACVVVLMSAPTAPALAQDVILNPAYIDATISIPNGDGGEYPIARLVANATAVDPDTGATYQATATAYNTNQLRLVVEAVEWPYEVRITAFYGPSYEQTRYVRMTRSTLVQEGTAVALEYRCNAFLSVTASVVGEPVTGIRISASPTCVVEEPQRNFSINTGVLADGATFKLPVIGGAAPYRVNVTAYLATPNPEYPENRNYISTSLAATVGAGETVEATDLPPENRSNRSESPRVA